EISTLSLHDALPISGEVARLGDSGAFHLERVSVVEVFANPDGVVGDARVVHDFASGDRSEMHCRFRGGKVQSGRPASGPGDVSGDLLQLVRNFPGAWASSCT